MDKEKEAYLSMFLWWYSIQIKKNKGHPAIYNNIYEPGKHYAKWNKPEKAEHCMILLYVEWGK